MQEAIGINNWEQFKKELYELYPGSTGEQKYLVTSLQSLIKKWVSDPIDTAEEFGIYHHSFLMIASFLKNKSWLLDREISFYFLEGLDQLLRSKVHGQLWVENPMHHTDDPYTLAEISTAALFVLSCNQKGKCLDQQSRRRTLICQK
jgi:hypothetical protein